MKLSFVIPAHNEEKIIGECLNSILEKKTSVFESLEIIVVNNASSDNTRQAALAHPGVKVVDEPQKGLSRARQTGFLASGGDLIANVDADTRLPDGWIEKVHQEFNKNPDLVALSGPYIYYDFNLWEKALVRFFYWLGYLIHLINHQILRKGAMLQGGNYILRRTALEKIGGYDISFDFYGEDTDIATRIQKVGRVKFTFKLPMYTSGRRLREEGIIRMGVRYALNHAWTIIFKKPLTTKVKELKK